MITAKVRDYRTREENKWVEVKVGDTVCFKSDYEQSGTIVKIEKRPSWNGGDVLHLHDDDGFGGDYLRYAKDTTERADDCWI